MKPLSGLTVISLAEQFPGPYATLLMADLGADVILVERPNGGDPARFLPEFFGALNRNKRSVCLDLKSDQGKADLKRLSAEADVLLEGYRPGVMARLGLGYPTLSEINPKLIYASITGFGQTGPNRDRPAHDLSYQALAGLLFRHARKVGPTPDVAIGDLSSAMFTAVAVLAALVGRQQSGKGTFIDVSMTDGLVSWMSVFLGPMLNNGIQFDVDAEPGYGLFECSDGRTLSLSIAHEDYFWRQLCECIGMPEHGGLDHAQRTADTENLTVLLRQRFATRPSSEWADILSDNDIPWGPVNNLQEVTQDPHFVARGLFTTCVGKHYVKQPLKFKGLETDVGRPPPGLGEHTEEVLNEIYKRGNGNL